MSVLTGSCLDSARSLLCSAGTHAAGALCRKAALKCEEVWDRACRSDSSSLGSTRETSSRSAPSAAAGLLDPDNTGQVSLDGPVHFGNLVA